MKKTKKIKLLSLFTVIFLVIILSQNDFSLFKEKHEDLEVDPTEQTVLESDDEQEWVDYHNSFKKFNDILDFDVFKMSVNDGENLVYSPLSIKKSLTVLCQLTDGKSNQQIRDLGIGKYDHFYFPNDSNKSLETGVFIKNISNDLESRANEALKYDNSYFVSVLDNITPAYINEWANNVSYGKIEELYNENEDLSDNVFVITNISMIDMNWVHRIGRGINLYSLHEDFHCFSRNFDYSGYEPLLFNNNDKVSGLSFASAANKYNIVDDLGYNNIKNTVYKAYQEWYIDEGSKYTLKPDEYIEDYMNEISSNYGQYSSSTDFYYYVDDEIKVFCKPLSNYDSLDLEYIGIMPIEENLLDYVSKFDGNKLVHILSNLEGTSYYDFKEGYCTKVHGCVPAFEFDSSINLAEILPNFGLTDIFNINDSNFTILTEDIPMFVDKFVNKTNITFSNDGIKALSSTILIAGGAGGPDFDYIYDVPTIDIDLTFDKPFMFIIRDKQSNSIFYIGSVYKPLEYIQFEGGELT